MAYESDTWQFESAVAITVVAAAVLKSKKAAMIAVGLAVMMCNPGSMQQAAREWQEDSLNVLENVRTGLTKLRTDAEKNGYWGGNNQGAYRLYSDATDTLDKLLAECEEKRKCSGETLQQSAEHGHGLTMFAIAVGGAMGILMLWSLGTRLLPIAAQLAVGLAIEGVTYRIQSTVLSVLKKLGLTTVIVASTLAAVGFSYESLVSELEKMKTGPDFAKADLKYVKGEGLTLKNPEFNSGSTAL